MVAADPVCLLLCRGMDVYTKHFSKEFHDEFYTCSPIVDAYSSYIATIVKRYAHEPSVLGTPLDYLLWSSYSPHLKAGNSPTTHAVPPVFLRRRVATLRRLLDGRRSSQQS